MKEQWNRLAKKIEGKSAFVNDYGSSIAYEEVWHPLSTLQYKHTAVGYFLHRIFDFYGKVTSFGELPEPFVVDLECFFYFAWGTLDSVGILLINSLKLDVEGRHRSFFGAIDNLCGKNTDIRDPVFAKVHTELLQGWIDQLGKYREYVTHEGLLMTQAALEWQQGRPLKHQVCLLPDDPLAKVLTYKKQIEAKDYAEDSMINLTGCIRDLLSFLVDKAFSRLVPRHSSERVPMREQEKHFVC